MSCGTDLIECSTVQIIEPNDDFLVDTGGVGSDMDERGELVLTAGQTSASVSFTVPKLNTGYHFEYLYVDAMGNPHPGAIQVVVTTQAIDAFAVAFAGSPLGTGYVLRWRVVVVSTSNLAEIDAPEELYLQMPQANTMSVLFNNQRSNTGYGFTELRVENLTEFSGVQTPINVMVVAKTINGFTLAVSPTPPSDFYFLKVRTP